MVLLTGLAHAAPQGLVVVLRDPDARMSGAPNLLVLDAAGTGRAITMADDGKSPDVAAGDGAWAGIGRDLVGPDYALLLTDAAGSRWEGKLTTPTPSQPSLTFSPGAEGAIAELAAGPVAAVTKAAATPAAASTVAAAAATDTAPAPGGGARWFAWLVGIAVVSWSLLGRGRTLARPRALADDRRGKGIVAVRGDADALILALAVSGRARVVVAGRPPTAPVPPGVVFPMAPGRVSVEEILEAIESLEGAGPPLVVVVNTRLEVDGGGSHQAALEALHKGLRKRVTAYVFTMPSPTMEAGPNGELRPVA